MTPTRVLLAALTLLTVSTAALAQTATADLRAGPVDPATGLRTLPYSTNPISPRFAHTGPTLFRSIRVIDGLGAPASAAKDVLVANGIIERIGTAGSIAPPAGAKVIEGKGLTLLPGLMDLHVHMVGLDRFAAGVVQDPALLSDVYRYKTYLYGYLYSGVTTILDVGTVPTLGIGLKRLIDAGHVLGPRYFWSGPIMEGGIELSSPFSDHMQAIPTSDKIGPALDYLQMLGVDMVKLYRRTPVWMMERIAAEAHRRGMRVITDAWERNNFSYLERIGRIDGSAHLNFHFRLTDEDAQEMAQTHNFAITTFYALNAFSGRIYQDRPNYYDSPLIADVLPPEYVGLLKAGGADPLAAMRAGVHAIAVSPVEDLMEVDAKAPQPEQFRAMSKIGGENLRKLLKAGVLIAAGTDGGEGESLLTELELIVVEGGVTPVQAIQMATGNAAKVLRKDSELGAIRQGLIADLLVVRGAPDQQIGDLRQIEHVLKDGKIIDRASLTRQWAY